MTTSLIQISYLAAAVLFILGLRGLTAPDTHWSPSHAGRDSFAPARNR